MDKIHEMIEKIEECMCAEISNGIQNVDTEEMYKVADIFKDLCEAEYYCKISKAMDESGAEYGVDYDYRGKYYIPMRDSKGRYMKRYNEPETMRYDDRMDDWQHGRMYYTETMPESEYERTRKAYTESKTLSPSDKAQHLSKLNKHIDTIASDMRSTLSSMSNEERTTMKQRLMNLANEI